MRDIFLKHIFISVMCIITLPLWGMDPFKRSYEQDRDFFCNNGAKIASVICLGDQENGYISTSEAQRFYPGNFFDKQCPEVCLVPIHIKNNEDECLFSNVLLPYQLLLKDTYNISVIFKSYDNNKSFKVFEFGHSLEYKNSDKETFCLDMANKVTREYCMRMKKNITANCVVMQKHAEGKLIEQALKYEKKIAAVLRICDEESRQSLSLQKSAYQAEIDKLKKNKGCQQGDQQESNALKAEIDALNRTKKYWIIGYVLLSMYTFYVSLRLAHIIH